jgi:hypothetical protein
MPTCSGRLGKRGDLNIRGLKVSIYDNFVANTGHLVTSIEIKQGKYQDYEVQSDSNKKTRTKVWNTKTGE